MGTTSLLKDDTDPVHSPDDPPPGASASDSGFSSSLTGSSDVNIPDEAKPTGHRKLARAGCGSPGDGEGRRGCGHLRVEPARTGRQRCRGFSRRWSRIPRIPMSIGEWPRRSGSSADFANAKANYLKVIGVRPRQQTWQGSEEAAERSAAGECAGGFGDTPRGAASLTRPSFKALSFRPTDTGAEEPAVAVWE